MHQPATLFLCPKVKLLGALICLSVLTTPVIALVKQKNESLPATPSWQLTDTAKYYPIDVDFFAEIKLDKEEQLELVKAFEKLVTKESDDKADLETEWESKGQPTVKRAEEITQAFQQVFTGEISYGLWLEKPEEIVAEKTTQDSSEINDSESMLALPEENAEVVAKKLEALFLEEEAFRKNLKMVLIAKLIPGAATEVMLRKDKAVDSIRFNNQEIPIYETSSGKKDTAFNTYALLNDLVIYSSNKQIIQEALERSTTKSSLANNSELSLLNETLPTKNRKAVFTYDYKKVVNHLNQVSISYTSLFLALSVQELFDMDKMFDLMASYDKTLAVATFDKDKKRLDFNAITKVSPKNIKDSELAKLLNTYLSTPVKPFSIEKHLPTSTMAYCTIANLRAAIEMAEKAFINSNLRDKLKLMQEETLKKTDGLIDIQNAALPMLENQTGIALTNLSFEKNSPNPQWLVFLNRNEKTTTLLETINTLLKLSKGESTPKEFEVTDIPVSPSNLSPLTQYQFFDQINPSEKPIVDIGLSNAIENYHVIGATPTVKVLSNQSFYALENTNSHQSLLPKQTAQNPMSRLYLNLANLITAVDRQYPMPEELKKALPFIPAQLYAQASYNPKTNLYHSLMNMQFSKEPLALRTPIKTKTLFIPLNGNKPTLEE